MLAAGKPRDVVWCSLCVTCSLRVAWYALHHVLCLQRCLFACMLCCTVFCIICCISVATLGPACSMLGALHVVCLACCTFPGACCSVVLRALCCSVARCVLSGASLFVACCGLLAALLPVVLASLDGCIFVERHLVRGILHAAIRCMRLCMQGEFDAAASFNSLDSPCALAASGSPAAT